MDELQAASAVGQGDLFRAYESRLGGHGARAAQVLLTAADIGARTNYLNARQTLRRLIEWGVVPVVNENDTTATDEITLRRQRLPRRSGGDPARCAVARPALQRRRCPQRRSPPRRGGGADRRGERLLPAGRPGDRRPHLGFRLGRDAEQGRGRGDGQRGRDPLRDLQRHPRRHAVRGGGRRGGRHPLRCAGWQGVQLQALAQVRKASRRAGSRSTAAPPACCARAAPACCRSGSSPSRESSSPATQSRSPATAP